MLKPGFNKRIKELAGFNITSHCVSKMVSRDATGRPPPFLSFIPSNYIFVIPLYCLLLSEEYNFIKVDAMAPTRNNSLAFNIVNYTSLLTVRTSMTSFRNCHYLR